MSVDLSGRYAFRFNGFDNNSPYLHHIAGLGWLVITKDSAEPEGYSIKGGQRFAKVLMTNTSSPYKVKQDGYVLAGYCTPGLDDGFGSATMHFQVNNQTAFIGQYIMQRIDKDRFWLISNGLTNHDQTVTYAEVASIEVVRKG
jgi:hypothetical protein